MKKALLWGAALFAILALMGCKKEPEPPEPFTLTINNIPALEQGKVIGASLLNSNNIETPVAIGVPDAAVKIFVFYYPSSGSGLPYDSNRPFSEPGNYLVALGKTTMTDPFNPEETYFYKSDKTEVSFPTSASLAWSDFKLKQ